MADCESESSSYTVLEPSTFEIESLQWDPPEPTEDERVKESTLQYNGEDYVLLQTPVLSVDIRVDEGIVVLSPTKAQRQSEFDFFNFIGDIDNHNIDFVQSNSKAWFDLRENFRRATVDDRYEDLVVGKSQPRMELPMLQAEVQCYTFNSELCETPGEKFDAELLLHIHGMRFEQKHFKALVDIVQFRMPPKPVSKKVKRSVSFGKCAMR